MPTDNPSAKRAKSAPSARQAAAPSDSEFDQPMCTACGRFLPLSLKPGDACPDCGEQIDQYTMENSAERAKRWNAQAVAKGKKPTSTPAYVRSVRKNRAKAHAILLKAGKKTPHAQPDVSYILKNLELFELAEGIGTLREDSFKALKNHGEVLMSLQERLIKLEKRVTEGAADESGDHSLTHWAADGQPGGAELRFEPSKGIVTLRIRDGVSVAAEIGSARAKELESQFEDLGRELMGR